MNADKPTGERGKRKIYVTLTGLPLSFHFDWPFHRATSGADLFVLHADVVLENSGGLHAPAAVNLSATVREVMPSLEPPDAEGPVINTLRKEIDRRQFEFLKSGKLVPVHFSSRHYDFKRNKWIFGKATDEEMALLVARKVFWQTRTVGGPVWVGDPTEALYVETTTDHVLEIAHRLESEDLIHLDEGGAIRDVAGYGSPGELATATPVLMDQKDKFESDMRVALEELEKKHAFERG